MLVAALFILYTPLGARATVVLDDRGHAVDASAPARRVVALAPHLAELMHEAGAGDLLLASVRGADFPAAVARLPQVGDAAGIDLERVLALRPDLVLAWGSGNRAADISRLERLGVSVFVSEPRTLPDVARTLRAVGVLTGRNGGAAAAQRYELHLAAMRAQSARPVAVFAQIWDRPVMTVNGQHLISQAIAHCGGRNVFEALPALAGSVSREEVLSANPETILLLAPPSRAPEWKAAWGVFERLRDRPMTALDPDLLTRATTRLLRGVEAVCAAVSAARAERRSPGATP